jgi:CheY-like chemotaxis protein
MSAILRIVSRREPLYDLSGEEGMGPKILLVDDSEELVSAYLAFLEGTTSYEVRTAASGHAALRILECWRPDIIA